MYWNVALFVVSACTVGPEWGSVDGLDPLGGCLTAPTPIVASACVEAPYDWTEEGRAYSVNVSGTVVDIGPGWTARPETLTMGSDCRAPEHQMELVDAEGGVWRIGWSLGKHFTEGPAGKFALGQSLRLHVSAQSWAYTPGVGVLISDDRGPLLIYDGNRALQDAPLMAEDVLGEVCVIDDVEYTVLGFVGERGALYLASGQAGFVDVGGEELQVVVSASARSLTCLDGCSERTWMAWRAR